MGNGETFVAYSSLPRAIGDTVEAAVQQIHDRSGLATIKTWKENDIAGRFVGTEVIGAIGQAAHVLADVTVLNFNVTYEIGYAIGLEKPLVLVRNAAIEEAGPSINEVGVFDTLGYQTYENSSDLAAIFRAVADARPVGGPPGEQNRKAPVYVTDAKFKTDPATRIIARVKKARLGFRSFDPNEQPRLSGPDAIRQVAQSFGVLVHFVPNTVADARVHNLRSAFLAGLSHGMGRVTLLLQNGDEPVPIDYRDLVVAFYHPEQIDEAVAEFATKVTEAFQVSVESPVRVARNLLEKMNLGASSAENELRDLGEYYLEIDAYQRALRGDVRVVVGRKGSGKSAIFHRVRDRIRSTKSNIVLDLKPEGYKFLKFKEDVLRLMTSGTLEHTVTAFWEYLLLLEICYKILEKDRIPHTRDPRLFGPYRSLADAYDSDLYVGEGDFSERLSVLLEHLRSEFRAKYGDGVDVRLSEAQLTELLYVHDVRALREQVENYLQLKDSLWLLFDNIDKGWPAHGIQGEDVVIIRALLEATRKIERQLDRHNVACRTLVFLRNDVYELLVQQTPDRGKDTKVALDWTDPDLLRELLRRRFVFSGFDENLAFEDIWHSVAVSHVAGEESSQYVIERCLMRPRGLLDLLNHCRSVAINLRHERIEESDFRKGVAAFSADLLAEIGLEIRDVLVEAENVLYEFIGSKERMPFSDVEAILSKVSGSEQERDAFLEILLWYGVLGLVRLDGEVTYIYSVSYDLNRLLAVRQRLEETGLVYAINPAFVAGLEVES